MPDDFLSKPPKYLTANNRLVQQASSDVRLIRDVFQRLDWIQIDWPEMWTRADQDRAQNEGWAVGNVLHVPRRGVLAMPSAWMRTFTIGKLGGTFVSDADAAAWVEQQAGLATGAVGVYKRALAVVARLVMLEGA